MESFQQVRTHSRHIPTGSTILRQQLLPKCSAGQGRSSLVSRRPVAMTNRQSWTDVVRGVENGSNTWEGHVAAKSLQLLSGVWIDLCLNLGGQGRQTIMRLNRIQLQFKKKLNHLVSSRYPPALLSIYFSTFSTCVSLLPLSLSVSLALWLILLMSHYFNAFQNIPQ